jgi:uncharacterized repeat protein (TIGR04138 family)
MLCDECKQREAKVFATMVIDCPDDPGKSETRARNLCEVCGKEYLDAIEMESEDGPEFPASYVEQLEMAAQMLPSMPGPYPKTARVFVMKGMVRAMMKHREETGGEMSRISAAEVLEGLREEARERLGDAALEQLASWGIHNCGDFGEIVFASELDKMLAEGTTREVFDAGYDFKSAFGAGGGV